MPFAFTYFISQSSVLIGIIVKLRMPSTFYNNIAEVIKPIFIILKYDV